MSRPVLANVFVSWFEAISVLLAAATFIIVSTFAILLLIPSAPFDHRHVTLGVVLLVLDAVATAILFAWILKFFCYRHHWYGYDTTLAAPLHPATSTVTRQHTAQVPVHTA
jgi:hypothetical protein